MNAEDKRPATVRLMCHRIAQTMTQGRGMLETARAIQSGEISKHATDAKQWVADSIAVVRSARDANPNWSDDDIAEQVLAAIEKQKQ